MLSETIIGVDLGTTKSAVAAPDGGRVTVIPNQLGELRTPSVVSFDPKGEVLVGSPAKGLEKTQSLNASLKQFLD